jgi:hypothetical protein
LPGRTVPGTPAELLPWQDWRDSDNIVAPLNLPNMRYDPSERVAVYAMTRRGLMHSVGWRAMFGGLSSAWFARAQEIARRSAADSSTNRRIAT